MLLRNHSLKQPIWMIHHSAMLCLACVILTISGIQALEGKFFAGPWHSSQGNSTNFPQSGAYAPSSSTLAWAYTGTAHALVGAVVTATSTRLAYFATSDGYVFAQTIGCYRTTEWSADLGSPVTAGLALSDDEKTVFVGTKNGRLHALNAKTGDFVWKSPFLMSPVVPVTTDIRTSGGILYFGAGNGPGAYNALYAVNGTTGEYLWKCKSYGGFEMPVTIANWTHPEASSPATQAKKHYYLFATDRDRNIFGIDLNNNTCATYSVGSAMCVIDSEGAGGTQCADWTLSDAISGQLGENASQPKRARTLTDSKHPARNVAGKRLLATSSQRTPSIAKDQSKFPLYHVNLPGEVKAPMAWQPHMRSMLVGTIHPEAFADSAIFEILPVYDNSTQEHGIAVRELFTLSGESFTTSALFVSFMYPEAEYSSRLLVVGTGSGHLLLINSTRIGHRAEIVWDTYLDREYQVANGPVVTLDGFVVGTNRGQVSLVSRTGERMWSAQTDVAGDLGLSGCPTPMFGGFLVGNANGVLTYINAECFAPAWAAYAAAGAACYVSITFVVAYYCAKPFHPVGSRFRKFCRVKQVSDDESNTVTSQLGYPFSRPQKRHMSDGDWFSEGTMLSPVGSIGSPTVMHSSSGRYMGAIPPAPPNETGFHYDGWRGGIVRRSRSDPSTQTTGHLEGDHSPGHPLETSRQSSKNDSSLRHRQPTQIEMVPTDRPTHSPMREEQTVEPRVRFARETQSLDVGPTEDISNRSHRRASSAIPTVLCSAGMSPASPPKEPKSSDG